MCHGDEVADVVNEVSSDTDFEIRNDTKESECVTSG